jgi:hypothetical protein
MSSPAETLSDVSSMDISDHSSTLDVDMESGEESGDEDVGQDSEGGWSDEESNIEIEALMQTQELNIRHEPVPAPKSSTPFRTQQELAVFQMGMSEMGEAKRVPIGYGLLQAEWGDYGNTYVPYHYIPTRHRGRELRIDLPHDVWYNRALQWAQGLYLMDAIIAMRAT